MNPPLLKLPRGLAFKGVSFAAGQAALGTAYLQLQLLGGQWKAVNILSRPANNLFPPPPPVKK